MRVIASQIELEASNSVVRTAAETVQGRYWSESEERTDTLALSEHARAAALGSARSHATSLPSDPAIGISGPRDSSSHGRKVSEVSEDDDLLNNPEGVRLFVMRRLLEATTGKEVKIIRAKDLKPSEEATESLEDASPQAPAPTSAQTSSGPSPRAGWGLELDIERQVVETQSSNFTAKGSIVTTDGKVIAFDATFAKQSTSINVEKVSLRAGDARMQDPLVLLYSGTQAELAESMTRFDLNADGRLEQLPAIANGAYVVHDKNGNRQVDDGTELLGALSGDGFADLQALDDDKNGFVDTGDRQYENLYAWQPTGDGQGTLTRLSAAGVGALYATNVATPFDLKAQNGVVQGRVRTTGIYVTEQGLVRPMEQIDLKA